MFGLDTRLPDIHLCTHHHFFFKSETRSCKVFQGDLKLLGFSELPSMASRVTRTIRIYNHGTLCYFNEQYVSKIISYDCVHVHNH